MHENRRSPSRPRVDVAALLMLAASLGLVVSIVAATVSLRDEDATSAAASTDDAIASVAVLIPDDRLDPRVAALALEGRGWTDAVGRFDAAVFAVNDNARRLTTAQDRLGELTDESERVAAEFVAVTDEAASLEERLAEVESILQERALARFVSIGAQDELRALDDPQVATDAARSAELGERVDEVQFSTREDLLEQQVGTERRQLDLLARQVEVRAEIESTESVIERRQADVAELLAQVDAAAAAVRSARWSATIPGTDLSVVALDAYLNAEELLAETWPDCNITWAMLAGVARIESRHGRFGGRTLNADGRPDRPIIGIALDGRPGIRAMPDTDGGRFDQDVVWDRAVGPLQFIPETWIRRGRDATGDGFADPQNIYDASYSAGRYLCALGGDVSERSNLRDAYFGYNNSTAYVNDVIGHADRYADFELPAAPEADPDPSETVVGAVENPD
ncbi:MAG: hypothetical protein AAF548_10405 [Actinomycetota bacterium]